MRITFRGLIILALLLLPATNVTAQPEPSATKTVTGTITGRVTVAGKPRARVTVVLEPAEPAYSSGRRPVATAETDEDGNYTLRGIKPGSYRVKALTPDTARTGTFAAREVLAVHLVEGETIDGMNFGLEKGAVITGKVLDSDGWPVTGQQVKLETFDARGEAREFALDVRINRGSTDDRGVFRMFGLPPGKYLVSVGDAVDRQLAYDDGERPYLKRYHPDSDDPARATVVEVGEGAEAAGIDIKLAPRLKAFAVEGRVVDAQTKKGMPGIRIEYGMTDRRGDSFTRASRDLSTGTGEFRVEGLTTGRYSFSVSGQGGSETEYYSEPIPVEVSDGEVTGVEILARRGGSISGVVSVEGTRDPGLAKLIAQMAVRAWKESGAPRTELPFSRIAQLRDGSFRIAGLKPGVFRLGPYSGLDLAKLRHVRTERDGADVRVGIELGEGEHVTGVRMVLAYAAGRIQGQIVDADSKVHEGAVFLISARSLDTNNTAAGGGARSDVRGGFLLQGLLPGQYELYVVKIAQVSGVPGPSSGSPLARQTVTVTNDQTTRVTIKVSSEPNR